MAVYGFMDDYSEGCHPEILAALSAHNLDQQLAYGADDYSVQARELIAHACAAPAVAVHLVASGTLANLIICAAIMKPYEAVISASSGHIESREAGAIEATGHKILTAPSHDGKLRPADVEQVVNANSQHPHMVKPRVVYISNATEFGTVYTRAELQALRSVCDDHDLLLFVDGARLGVALEAEQSGMSLQAMAELTDIFWIGGTKAGTLFGEAIVIPNEQCAHEFAFHMKQRGALLAKGRALGLQFRELFTNDLFTRLAAKANDDASALSAGLTAAGYELAAATESNQVFPIMPSAVIERLQEHFRFHTWEQLDDDRSVIRLVTSWATDPAEIDRFLSLV